MGIRAGARFFAATALLSVFPYSSAFGAGLFLSTNSSATVVAGQPDFINNGANNSPPSIWARSTGIPAGVWTDGTKLIVADTGNNRILIYHAIPTANNAAADVVVGQPDMISFSSGTSAHLMNGPAGVYSDGTRLFVADTGNNRVLIYNTIPAANNAAADVVVGEPDLFTPFGGTSSYLMSGPSGLYSNGTRLFVADTFNSRVLIYNTIPTANNAAADVVEGEPDMVSGNGGTSAKLTYFPGGVYSDGTRLFVADTFNSRVLIYNTIPTANNAAADVAVGQPDIVSGGAGTSGANVMNFPSGVYSDGTRLFVADTDNSRVLIYNTIPTSNNAAANVVAGQPDFLSTSDIQDIENPTANSMNGPQGVCSDGRRLFVADADNNRVLIYNTIPTSNNAAADVVVGQPNMTSAGHGTSATAMDIPQDVYTDGTRLFVADAGNNRILIYNTIPTANNAAADVAVGQPNMISSRPGIGAKLMNGPYGVYSAGTRLFVADTNNSRVLIYNTIPTSNNAAADIVAGEPDMVSSQGGTSAKLMMTPYGVYSDGTKLFVSDSLNNRILIYNTIPTANNAAADVVMGQPNMVSSSSGTSATLMSLPASIHSDGTRLFAADTNNSRVLIYNTVPTTNNAAADVALGQPDLNSGTANRGAAQGGANTMNAPADVYSDGIHLFVADDTNNRVLIYQLSAPGSFSGKAQGASSISWTWSPVNGQTGYRVVSSTGGNESGDLSPTMTFWTETGLFANTIDTRAVAAFNGTQISTSAFVGVYSLAAAPTGLAVNSVNLSSFTLSWSSNTNPTGTRYRALLWTAGGSTTTFTLTSLTTSFTQLSAETTYFATVNAVNGDGVLAPAGITLSTVTLSSMAAPSNASASLGPPGGILSFDPPHGQVSLLIPPGALTQTTTVDLSAPAIFSSAPSPSAMLTPVHVGVDITLNPQIEPQSPVTVQVSYLPADVGSLNENEFVLARYDRTENAWIPLLSTIDVVNRVVTAQTDRLSLFQIMQSAASNSVKTAKAFPNPWRVARGPAAMTFSLLPANARLRIYTLNGLLIKDLTADFSGMASWDGTNQSGRPAASGFYFVFAQGAGGEKTVKIAIQR